MTWKSRSYPIDSRFGSAISAAAADLIGNKIYASHGTTHLISLSVYDIPTNSWTNGGPTTPDANVPRVQLGGGIAFGKHCAIGGSSGGAPSAAVEAFDPATNTWTIRASMSVARAGLGVASLDDKLYAIGGRVSSAYGVGPYLNTNEVYDPNTDTWTTRAPLPVATSDATSVVGLNGKIYVFGGWDAQGLTSRIQIYDVAGNTWCTGTPMPTPRYNALAGVINGRIAVYGGGTPEAYTATVTPSVSLVVAATEFYDPASNTWELGPLMRSGIFMPVQGMLSNGSQVFALGSSLSALLQVLDSSVDPQLTIASISPTSGAQGATVSATITGTNLSGVTFVGFTGTGVTATVLPGGTSTSVPVSITIAPGAAIGTRTIWADSPAGTSNLFGNALTGSTGFTVTTP